MSWRVILSRQAVKDVKLLAQAEKLLKLLAENPFVTPPPYEKLVGNLRNFYSR